jgi:F-type H+-transporting ATPase subunit epsilon
LSLELTIVTPEREVFRGPVESVVLPGTQGEFGVLAGHEPFLTALEIGRAELRTSRGSSYAAMSGGFAEVGAERAVVMVETCELAEEIDVDRAERARSRAEKSIEQLRRDGADERTVTAVEMALRRAITRIGVAGQS